MRNIVLNLLRWLVGRKEAIKVDATQQTAIDFMRETEERFLDSYIFGDEKMNSTDERL